MFQDDMVCKATTCGRPKEVPFDSAVHTKHAKKSLLLDLDNKKEK